MKRVAAVTDPSPLRWPRALALALGVAAASHLAVGVPGHAAGLPVTSETLTTDIVGNPP